MSLYHSSFDPSSRSRGYIPGKIANLPSRNRPSVYRHTGHTRNEIREQYPHFTEISGGFAEIVLVDGGRAGDLS